MPTIMHYLDEPLRLRVSSRHQRPTDLWRLLCLLLGSLRQGLALIASELPTIEPPADAAPDTGDRS